MDYNVLRQRLAHAEQKICTLEKELAGIRPAFRASLKATDISAAYLMAAQLTLEYLAEEAPTKGGQWVAEKIEEYFAEQRRNKVRLMTGSP